MTSHTSAMRSKDSVPIFTQQVAALIELSPEALAACLQEKVILKNCKHAAGSYQSLHIQLPP